MVSFVRISALSWADMLAGFVMFVMVTYLTNVMGLSPARAAGTINFWNGVASILPIGFAFCAESIFKGDYYMLIFSSTAYTIGLGLLSLSTPPVTGLCSDYKPGCIGNKQKDLVYVGLALIAVGMAGHFVSLKPFLEEQTKPQRDSEGTKNGDESTEGWQVLGMLAVIVFDIAGGIGLPYIKPWSIRFGIPAICTLAATIAFLTKHNYKHKPVEGSSLKTILRVFVAAASKLSQPHPAPNQLYNEDDTDPTRTLRCLDKAAMFISDTPTSQEKEKENKWTLCRVSEVEDTKTGIRMVPMWMTFILVGVVLSVGNTYFVEQANKMNRKLGHIKVPIPIFMLFSKYSKDLATQFYTILKDCAEKYAPPIGIAVAMVFSVLCCIIAAKVENRRLHVIRDHGLLDKPNDTIPMSIFWLLPQFLLLALLDGISSASIEAFFEDQAPDSIKKYLRYFTNAVNGLGTLASILMVYVVGKVSGRNGKPNWFQNNLNKSRLDRYYWTLAVLSAVNLVIYILVAYFYPYKEPEKEDGNSGEQKKNKVDAPEAAV